jgi:hypothetical protein
MNRLDNAKVGDDIALSYSLFADDGTTPIEIESAHITIVRVENGEFVLSEQAATVDDDGIARYDWTPELNGEHTIEWHLVHSDGLNKYTCDDLLRVDRKLGTSDTTPFAPAAIVGQVAPGATGAVRVSGASSGVVGGVASSATGIVVSTGTIIGSQSATVGEAFGSASAAVRVAGSQSASIGSAEQSATGSVRVAGDQGATIGLVTPSAAGIVSVVGTQSATVGSVSQTAAGTVASSFAGVIDEILAAGGALPNCAYSVSHRLYSGYTGSLFLLRRTSNGDTQAIGYDGSGFVDTALIASFCSGTTGTVQTIYDQTGNGRDLTQATAARQPEIYASGAVHMVGSLPTTVHVGGSGSGGTSQGWARGDSGGFTGDQALSIWAFSSITDTSTSARSVVNIGAGANAFTFRHILSQGLGANNNTGSLAGGYRAFTLSTAVGTLSDYLVTSAASANMSAATLYQRGSSMSQSSVVAGTYSIATTALSIGANESQARGMTGRFNSAILFGYVASGGVKTAGDDLGADLRTIAGV